MCSNVFEYMFGQLLPADQKIFVGTSIFFLVPSTIYTPITPHFWAIKSLLIIINHSYYSECSWFCICYDYFMIIWLSPAQFFGPWLSHGANSTGSRTLMKRWRSAVEVPAATGSRAPRPCCDTSPGRCRTAMGPVVFIRWKDGNQENP